MTNQDRETKVNAVFIVKDEWPLLAVTISHALTNYAEKVIIIDTGSQDGIFEGIRLLEALWKDRVQLFRCSQEIYDQIPLTNLLIEMSKENDADWTMVLDADEFFVHENYLQFLKKLSETSEYWSSYSLPVANFAVNEGHDDFNLEAFGEITSRIISQGAGLLFDQEFPVRVISGELPLQARNVPHKILVRNSSSIFLALGAHQVVFGDGIDWVRHDSSVSSVDVLGGMICHLPFTSTHRLKARVDRTFFDGGKTFSRLNNDDFNNLSISELISRATIGSENKDKWLQASVIIEDNQLSETLKPVIEKLQKFWPHLTLATFNSEVADSFPDSLDLKIVSQIIRKYHTRAQTLWDRTSDGE